MNAPAAEIPRIFHYFTRLVLTGLFLAISVLQLLSFPGQFRNEASQGGASQASRWFLTFMVGIWFLFAQIAIVALWRILTMIYQHTLKSPQGIKWVNLLVNTLGAAAIYGGGILILALVETDDPGPVVVVGSLTAFIFSTYVISFFIRFQIFHERL